MYGYWEIIELKNWLIKTVEKLGQKIEPFFPPLPFYFLVQTEGGKNFSVFVAASSTQSQAFIKVVQGGTGKLMR